MNLMAYFTHPLFLQLTWLNDAAEKSWEDTLQMGGHAFCKCVLYCFLHFTALPFFFVFVEDTNAFLRK